MFSNRLARKADEELMRLVQGGSERALTEIYQRYSKKLIRYFYRMLWQEEAKAQDLLHDLFVKLIERPAKFDADRKFSTWIYAVAFNMCKNEYRKRAFMNHNGHRVNGFTSEGAVQPDIDHKDFKHKLEDFLEDDEETKNLFVLRYELDLSMHEMATALGCPEGTVKSRLFHLKRKLAMKLRDYNPAFNQ